MRNFKNILYYNGLTNLKFQNLDQIHHKFKIRFKRLKSFQILVLGSFSDPIIGHAEVQQTTDPWDKVDEDENFGNRHCKFEKKLKELNYCKN